MQDFVAVREDEISVFRGEKVQILASNQQGQSLVYRPANSDSPAAEGWVPRSILKTHWRQQGNGRLQPGQEHSRWGQGREEQGDFRGF